MNTHISFKKNIAILALLLSSLWATHNTLSAKKEGVPQNAQIDTFKEKDPISYNKGNSFQRFLGWTDEKQKITEQILQVIGGKKESLLDIGAGNGKLTELLEHNFEYICAAEPSIKLFEELEQTLSKSSHTLINLPFEQVNFKKAGIETQFDVIVASHSFQYVKNPAKQLTRINNLLKDSGVFLLINLRPCDFWDFFNKYKEGILGERPTDPSGFDYDIHKLLETIFDVEKISFDATVSIPSVQDTISILDFLYNIEFSDIEKNIIKKITHDLTEKYDDGPVNFNFSQNMYICRKKL